MDTQKTFHEILREKLRQEEKPHFSEENPPEIVVQFDFHRLTRPTITVLGRRCPRPYSVAKKKKKPKAVPSYQVEQLSMCAQTAANRLNLPERFTVALLKRRFRQMAKDRHPDLKPDAASNAFIQLKIDYDLICTEIKSLIPN